MAESITNAYNSFVGGAKETIGKVLGNESLAGSGAAERAEAQARSNTQQAEQSITNTVDSATGRVKSTVGAATGDAKLEAEGHVQQAKAAVNDFLN